MSVIYKIYRIQHYLRLFLKIKKIIEHFIILLGLSRADFKFKDWATGSNKIKFKPLSSTIQVSEKNFQKETFSNWFQFWLSSANPNVVTCSLHVVKTYLNGLSGFFGQFIVNRKACQRKKQFKYSKFSVKRYSLLIYLNNILVMLKINVLISCIGLFNYLF